ncbi:hypothetical protein GALMADRAFT_245552 [Galerina marginata CBS 339.88]|uniref:Uncharacterized protein n=1 Tax=Galerina marginata (strain CBS 339.88) TaxID=685588 RepID=A0A067TES2_GALM3|nr:hypothetical protein GALMADRAFT_245552 [Galerina marginata CBS 339.88]
MTITFEEVLGHFLLIFLRYSAPFLTFHLLFFLTALLGLDLGMHRRPPPWASWEWTKDPALVGYIGAFLMILLVCVPAYISDGRPRGVDPVYLLVCVGEMHALLVYFASVFFSLDTNDSQFILYACLAYPITHLVMHYEFVCTFDVPADVLGLFGLLSRAMIFPFRLFFGLFVSGPSVPATAAGVGNCGCRVCGCGRSRPVGGGISRTDVEAQCPPRYERVAVNERTPLVGQ